VKILRSKEEYATLSESHNYRRNKRTGELPILRESRILARGKLRKKGIALARKAAHVCLEISSTRTSAGPAVTESECRRVEVY